MGVAARSSGFRYHRAYAARAVALSDLIPLHQWKKTKLYNEVYSKMGMHEQIMGVLPYASPDLCEVVVNRTRRTFTERDRSVLNVARFHISEACRKAKMCAAIPSPELTRAFEPLVGGSIVVLNTTGAVQSCPELARARGAFLAGTKEDQWTDWDGFKGESAHHRKTCRAHR